MSKQEQRRQEWPINNVKGVGQTELDTDAACLASTCHVSEYMFAPP
ncbi:hypothetical protein PAECIP111893_03656 [Paenibacillus plantiphilus]|uniref:Lantibiotic n=1 Tax=Paenibacillus plantiphilus TaxID=2905650 RepID=A0ABM9CI49_9BACL|nr:hypothetical protein [Paenibacillus plantiphilus]CAH1213257.1 hypothetical protein PAECIP111893_03656 [Paenibacillus plantiphilus]